MNALSSINHDKFKIYSCVSIFPPEEGTKRAVGWSIFKNYRNNIHIIYNNRIMVKKGYKINNG